KESTLSDNQRAGERAGAANLSGRRHDGAAAAHGTGDTQVQRADQGHVKAVGVHWAAQNEVVCGRNTRDDADWRPEGDWSGDIDVGGQGEDVNSSLKGAASAVERERLGKVDRRALGDFDAEGAAGIHDGATDRGPQGAGGVRDQYAGVHGCEPL